MSNITMDKLKMQSRDVVGGNVEKIAALFPHCVTERLGKDGKTPELAIDFDKLRSELSNDVLDEGEERYQFTWPDKRAASRLANEPTTLTLRPCREESVDFDNTENLYIEGDNLDVLKVLRETYLGKVKMIYIDPPYNTGNDFVYNDDFAQGKGEFEQQNGLFDEEGNQTLDPMQRNSEANGRFHTDWLNMIYPRLKVAKDLLSDDGIIFISIDKNEVVNLRQICSEIFGEQNVELYIWDTREPGTLPKTATKTVRNDNEFLLAVFKREATLYKYSEQKYLEKQNEWTNADNDPRGPWMSANISRGAEGSTGGSKSYIITNPAGIQFDRDWAISEDEYFALLNDGRIYFSDNGNGVPRKKIFTTDLIESIQSSIFEKLKSATSASQDLKALMDRKLFDFPKPLQLIKRILSITTKKDSIILDFFSGSSTTAHAVMQLNAEDGGHRKFIMVQLPEATDEKSEACKAGYKNICEIGKERIRRAGRKIMENLELKMDKEASAGNSKLSTLNSKLDVGFRVLKLDSSNMQDVYYTPDKFDTSLFDSLEDNIKPDRTGKDLLFQVMLDLGIELSAKIESKEIAGKQVFSVDDDYLLACFDTDVNETTIEEMAKLLPTHLVIRDASAANDNVLDNFDQIIESYSNEKKITTHVL